MASSSSNQAQEGYSQEATVAAITSYYELLARVHPDSVSSLKYPPLNGWSQISRDSFSILGRTDTVIELLRHIPYFTSDQITFMKATTPKNYINSSLCERTHEESRIYNEQPRPIPLDMMGANPGYSPQGGGEPIPSSMFALAVLTEEQEEGYHVLLDTDRNIIILVRVGDEFPRGWPPVQPDASHEEWIGDDENEAGDEDKDESEGEHTDDEFNLYLCGHDWREMPAYRIYTFFKMCREQWRVMNWMPKMEWASQTHEEYIFTESECDTDCDTGLRRRITREAGWPGTDNEVGLGCDKAKAEKEMIELM